MNEGKKKISAADLMLPIVLTLMLGALIALSLFFEEEEAKELPAARSAELFGDRGELYFNTSCRFIDYSGLSDDKFSDAVSLVREELEFYHKLFDIYHTYDGIINIKSLNDNAGGEALEVPPRLFDLLEYSKQMYTLTAGEVNIAMGAVLGIWHEYREEGTAVPDKALLESAAAHTDIDKLILDRENMTVTLADSEMSLDVGAVAKGYAAEKIAGRLTKAGYSSFVLDLGGNLRAVGSKPDGTAWKTGVKNPDPMAQSYLYEFELADLSAVTSGDYERYYTVDGKKYHHIIDKDTLMPSEHFASVTVIAEHSGLADALSTALFNMTYEEGLALVNSLENIKAIWYTSDGILKISK